MAFLMDADMVQKAANNGGLWECETSWRQSSLESFVESYVKD